MNRVDIPRNSESPEDKVLLPAMTNRRRYPLLSRANNPIFLLTLVCLLLVWQVGCLKPRNTSRYPQAEPCQTYLEQIEYPDLCDESGTSGDELLSGPPLTISNYEDLDKWMLTLDECVVMALQGSKIMQRLGGIVVRTPQAVTTLYDPALQESNPQLSAEAALSDFDAQFSTSLFFNHNEQIVNQGFPVPNNNPPPDFIFALQPNIIADTSTFQIQLQKIAANGASFRLRSQTDYDRSRIGFPADVPTGVFPSFYQILNQVEVRQPLGRGFGTLYNQIAGPNAIEGQYNGVLIGRIRGDITLADFEAGVRDLIRDVEETYWELFFAYRDLDTKIKARDAARATWENRELRMSGGLDRPDDEAQARQQYFDFERQVVNALAGIPGLPGVIGAERQLRRLLGLPVSDGRIIRPATEPVATPIVFDWGDSQVQTLGRRVELRRQKWTIRQRELELIAAKEINRWQFDLVGQYGFKGFGNDLFGKRSDPTRTGSAFDNLVSGQLDDWQLGVELGGPLACVGDIWPFGMRN